MAWTSHAARAYRRASHSPSASWRDVEFCVLDLETTGLDPRRNHIVSWARCPSERAASRQLVPANSATVRRRQDRKDP